MSVGERVHYTLYLCYTYADLNQTGANSAEWAGGTANYILGNNTTQTTYSITLPFRIAGFYESEYNPLTFYISNNPLSNLLGYSSNSANAASYKKEAVC